MTGIDNFFISGTDVKMPGESVPHTSTGNLVTFLIDGKNYFYALRKDVEKLAKPGGTSKFFYFANWCAGLVDMPQRNLTLGEGSNKWSEEAETETAFKLDDGTGTYPTFIEQVRAMSANQTDVRALLWLHPFLLKYSDAAAAAPNQVPTNIRTILSAIALRAIPNMEKKVCLNIIGHPLGSIHTKVVICGDETFVHAYISGLDLLNSRMDAPTHYNYWHDVGAKIEGPAVKGIYEYFKQLWNENHTTLENFTVDGKDVYSVVLGTPFTTNIRETLPPLSGNATMRVQVLRTGPAMNFASGSTSTVPVSWIKRLGSNFRRSPWSFAPKGIFEFKLAVKKAITNAEKYIYAEDQGFWSREIMGCIRDRLNSDLNVKVILVHGYDPSDDPARVSNLLRPTNIAINNSLALGKYDKNRVAFYECTDGTVIHSKTWIIDDKYVIIGSANCMRRSLYTDGEMSVGIFDDDGSDKNFAQRYRTALWAEHCGITDPSNYGDLRNVDYALASWNNAWIVKPWTLPAVKLLDVFQRKQIPFKTGSAKDEWATVDMFYERPENFVYYDRLDADSRDTF